MDTADSYGPFIAEELIARALYPYQKELLIATKGGLTRHGPGRWVPCGHPAYLRQCVEMSLRRLKSDCIDLYYLHRVDPIIPMCEQVGVFVDLIREGKIRSFGLSKVDIDTIDKVKDMIQISAIQNKLNINDYVESDAVLKWCETTGTPFVSYAPLDAGNVLCGRTDLAELARQLGISPAQIALGWLLQRSPSILTIPGTQQAAHVIENIAAINLLGHSFMKDITL
ncbi:MAG: aldo/keto reductase [Gallionellaceae bacterium]